MAGQNGAKGNPATHRMGNPKRAERRQRAWKRAQARNERNRAKNDARMNANLEELKSLGGSQEMYERVTVDKATGKTLKRMKRESPGQALIRVRRAGG